MNPDAAALAMRDPLFVAPSVPGLIVDAPIGVQLAIAALLVALVWSAVVIVRKLIQFSKARKEADKFEKVFWSGQALDELYQALSQRQNGGMASLFVAALREWKRSTEGENGQPAPRPTTGVQALVEGRINVLKGKFGPNLSTTDKKAAWDAICHLQPDLEKECGLLANWPVKCKC